MIPVINTIPITIIIPICPVWFNNLHIDSPLHAVISDLILLYIFMPWVTIVLINNYKPFTIQDNKKLPATWEFKEYCLVFLL